MVAGASRAMILDPEMILDRDVGVSVRDGTVLRANVFRPDGEGGFPVLMTLGPYGKDVHLSQLMPRTPSIPAVRARPTCGGRC